MALTIPNYRQPGAYSTIIPNPTVATSSGPPIVVVIGQALRGPYDPTMFFSTSDAQNTYGIASKSNPLANGINFAFQNGAPIVTGVNVQPDNSTPAYLSIPFTSFPTSAYIPAPSSALDIVTNQPVNVNGNVVGTFYIQDFNPSVPDPVYNSTPLAAQQAYTLAGNTNMLQYEKLLAASFVPLANTQQQQVVVYTVSTSTPPVSSITQSQWNQFTNAVALQNALDGAYLSPVSAQLLIPDTGAGHDGPTIGGISYSYLYGAVGTTVNAGGVNPTVINSENDAYVYAMNHGGILYISALEAGTQHQILFGMFDTNLQSNTSTNGQALFNDGSNAAWGGRLQNGAANNPFVVMQPGSDGVITNNSYLNAINNLSGIRADIIVALNTDPAIQSALKTYVTTASSHDERNECIAIVSGPISELYTTTIQNVTALQGGPGAERMTYIWPTAGYSFDSVLNTTVALDGTYLACACAGILASHNSAEPLTHKVLSGFRDVGTHVSNSVADSIAKYGVCIIENNPNFGLRVRDGITCDPSTPETQEISVVRQLDYTCQSLRDILDANIIATAITRNTLGVVTTLATNTLQSLQSSGIIYGYQNVVARINPVDARQIDLSCLVRPAYPCRTIEITVSVTSSLTGF